MKVLYLFIVTLLFLSCSGTKTLNDNKEMPAPKTSSQTINKDTLASTQTKALKITDSLYVPQEDSDVKIINKPLVKTEETKITETTTEKKIKHTSKDTDDSFHKELTKKTKNPHELWNELLKSHVTDKGNVDYKSLKRNHTKLLDYIHVLDLVQKDANFNSISRAEKLAYWINAYNAMTVDLILRNYPVKSIKDIKDPWKQRHWKLGNKYYNLDEIEHEILRSMDEPRIHFAIVCASYSCPKLQNNAFIASNIEQQLTKATKEFLSDPERNAISQNNLELSKIFQWFAKDFKQNGSLIDFLNKYAEVQISKNAKKRFKDYSWDLNE